MLYDDFYPSRSTNKYINIIWVFTMTVSQPTDYSKINDTKFIYFW